MAARKILQNEQLQKVIRVNISITKDQKEALKKLSKKGYVSHGILIALKECIQYRKEKIALQRLRNEQI